MSDQQSSAGSSPREIRPPAPVHRQPILVPPDLLDISEDAVGSLEQHIAALYDGQAIAGSARPIEQAPTPLTDEFGYTPLTLGQQMHVDNLLSFVTDTLARDVLITMKREGLPPNGQWREFLEQYALKGWYAASDAIAWATLAKIANSDWDETFAYADSQKPVVLQDERESYIPLTPGQAHVVDDLLTQNIDGLAREALFALKQDGLPPENQWNEFIAQLEFPSGEETSDAQAFLMLETVASSDWNQLVGKEDSQDSVLLQEEHSEAQEPQPIVVIEEADGGSLDIVGGIPRWDELEEFVNTDLAELQRRAVQNPEIIRESMALLEGIFGYDVRFLYDEFYVGEGRDEEKKSAIKQIFNLASSHYHVTNTFGIAIMRTTAIATIYHLGADLGAKPVIRGYQPEFRGLVPLASGETGAFIGSEMTIGGITHETFHEIDRRFDGRLSVLNYEEPKWG